MESTPDTKTQKANASSKLDNYPDFARYLKVYNKLISFTQSKDLWFLLPKIIIKFKCWFLVDFISFNSYFETAWRF